MVGGLAVFFLACSGASSGDLFAGASGGAGAGGGDDASATGDDDTPRAIGDAGVGRDAGSREAGDDDRDGATNDASDDDASAHDAGPLAVVDCPSAAAASTTSATCDVGQAVCCSEGNGDFACTSASSCLAPAVAVPCDESTDCAALGQTGDVCCLQLGSNGKGTAVGCIADTSCTTAKNRRVMCDPTAATPCPTGQTCKLSTITFPGFYVCF